MLRNKGTRVFSETNSYFSSTEKGIFRIMELYKILKLYWLQIGQNEMPQWTFQKGDILLGLLLFPIDSIPKVFSYTRHSLKQTIEIGKNTFYRLKNDLGINWRSIVSKCNYSLFKQIVSSSTTESGSPKCLIIDDTDFEKSTYKTEYVSKIWSHAKHDRFFSFMGLFLSYWDGKSFFSLDFSLHKEKGKDEKKPFGFTSTHRKKQYSKKREKVSNVHNCEQRLTKDKITMAITLITKAAKMKLKVDYILKDSWFFCEAILTKALSLKVGIVVMAKMAKARCRFQNKEYTVKELQLLKQRKKVKWVKPFKLYCADVDVEYKSKNVKLFFCKTSKHGEWHLLVSTNTKLGLLKAYEIYSILWSIEVLFKESKNFFSCGKSQSQDFDAQVADISIAMIEYNIFNLAKRFETYEIIDSFFDDVEKQAMELTISMRIWRFTLKLLQIIVGFIDVDFNKLIVNAIWNDPGNNKIFRLIESRLLEAA